MGLFDESVNNALESFPVELLGLILLSVAGAFLIKGATEDSMIPRLVLLAIAFWFFFVSLGSGNLFDQIMTNSGTAPKEGWDRIEFGAVAGVIVLGTSVVGGVLFLIFLTLVAIPAFKRVTTTRGY